MAKKPLPCPTVLRQLLRYEPETGKLFWKHRPQHWFPSKRGYSVWNARYANAEAFTSVDAYGYKHGNLFNVRTKAHRLIWAYSKGAWAEHDIDHINGVRDDNRIENLRAVTRSVNLRNTKIRQDNTSGHVGVSLMPKSGRWRARVQGQTIGIFGTIEEAIAARKAAEVAHGYHPNHGRKADT